jgi:hypothetical protein
MPLLANRTRKMGVLSAAKVPVGGGPSTDDLDLGGFGFDFAGPDVSGAGVVEVTYVFLRPFDFFSTNVTQVTWSGIGLLAVEIG